MKNKFTLLISSALLSSFTLLTGCSTTSEPVQQLNKPVFMIQRYFNGPIKAHGVVLDRKGHFSRSFTIEMYGKWKNSQQGTLAEKIHYNDGEIQTREWHFQFSDPHHFTATAKDAVGVAQGTQYGNTVHMFYTLNVPVKNTTYAIYFDDLLYMLPKDKVFNRTNLSKFGFNLGEILITYDKK